MSELRPEPKPCRNCQHHQEMAAAFEARAEQLAHELSLANLALHLVNLPDPKPAKKPWRRN